ncbi:hypothetical protein P8452_56506 [Trifolium repens]|nr:hypothetical protein P8452_56506 [Trifolium repens]
MTEQNKLEDFSSQPPLHIDPHLSINIPDAVSVDSATAPTHGYPPSINIPDSGSVDSATAPTHGYLPGHQTFPIIKKDSATAPTQGSNVDVGEEKRVGFFGYGFGWDLFILGFFLLAIPWFIGAAMVISIVLDSIQSETCTDCLSEGANFS